SGAVGAVNAAGEAGSADAGAVTTGRIAGAPDAVAAICAGVAPPAGADTLVPGRGVSPRTLLIGSRRSGLSFSRDSVPDQASAELSSKLPWLRTICGVTDSTISVLMWSPVVFENSLPSTGNWRRPGIFDALLRSVSLIR